MVSLLWAVRERTEERVFMMPQLLQLRTHRPAMPSTSGRCALCKDRDFLLFKEREMSRCWGLLLPHTSSLRTRSDGKSLRRTFSEWERFLLRKVTFQLKSKLCPSPWCLSFAFRRLEGLNPSSTKTPSAHQDIPAATSFPCITPQLVETQLCLLSVDGS